MEVVLVFIIDQSIMEHSLAFMAKQSKYLNFFPYCSWITLQNTCAFFLRKEKQKGKMCIYVTAYNS